MLQAPVPQAIYVCGRCITPEDRPFVMGTTTFSGVCTRCGGQAAWMIDVRINEPRVGHNGLSPVFSTSCAIQRHPLHVWDVNGYYAALGVKPDATRLELRRAYQEIGGPDDRRLTYIMSQLLDPEVRSAYDAMPLGDIFIDQFVIAETLRRAKEEASQAIRDGYADVLEDLEDLDLSDALNGSFSALDSSRQRTHDERPTHPWGYYLWQSFCNDVASIGVWRSLIGAALWDRGVTTRIGVGYAKRMEPWCVERVGEATVVFLTEGVEPTEALAGAAAEAVQQLGEHSPFPCQEIST